MSEYFIILNGMSSLDTDAYERQVVVSCDGLDEYEEIVNDFNRVKVGERLFLKEPNATVFRMVYKTYESELKLFNKNQLVRCEKLSSMPQYTMVVADIECIYDWLKVKVGREDYYLYVSDWKKLSVGDVMNVYNEKNKQYYKLVKTLYSYTVLYDEEGIVSLDML